jgi:hypothetical protein
LTIKRVAEQVEYLIDKPFKRVYTCRQVNGKNFSNVREESVKILGRILSFAGGTANSQNAQGIEAEIPQRRRPVKDGGARNWSG